MVCPRCGFDPGDPDTVIDARSSLPRLSDIDRRWEMSVHDEPTRMQEVPYFKIPESLLQLRREISDSQRPTPLRPPPPRTRPWLMVVFALVVGIAVGGVLMKNEAKILRGISAVAASSSSPSPR